MHGTTREKTERRISGAKNLLRSRIVGFPLPAHLFVILLAVRELACQDTPWKLHSKITDSVSRIEPRQNATPIDAFVTIMRYPIHCKDTVVNLSLPFLPPDPIEGASLTNAVAGPL